MNTTPTRLKLRAEISDAFAELGAKIRVQRPDLAPEHPSPAAPAESEAARRLEDAVEAARRRAAVIGWFKPSHVVTVPDRRLRERVLSELVADCEVQPRGRTHLWRLRMEPRRKELAALAKDAKARARALRDTHDEEEDSETRLLRRVLRGKPLDAERVREEDAASILQVAEWTDGLFPNAPKTFEVRGLLARQAIKASLGLLLDNFRGREKELKRLRGFVAKPPGPDGRVPLLGVSGLGGVGKSTLLARFAEGLLQRPERARPAVVLIDFDRARFSSGDPTTLTFELTRQIAAWFPAIAAPLKELRHNARLNLLSSDFANTSQMATSVLEGAARSSSEMNHLLPKVLARANVGVAGGRPLVIVLDTFEVLQGAQDDESDSVGYRGVYAVAEWAQDLFSIGGLRELRVVVAGRAPIAEDPVFGPRLTEDEMRLRGLDPPSALALLRDQGLSAGDARLVLDAVCDPEDESSNPLILRLAARLVAAGKIRPSALKEERPGGGQPIDQELVQGILYQRILAHIGAREKDKTLAALAHPGLVLRRVTPHLIEHVLFPLTELKKEKAGSAQDLFERLRREVWLVQQTGPDTLSHRADLRRTMLRLIDADMPETARKIHRAASRYYAAGRDPQLSPELAAGEAFYHRLMLMSEAQAARLDPAEVRRFESAISLTLDDLPPSVRSVVKSVLDRPLSDEEGKNLPEPRRTEFILRQGERYLLNDEPYRALKLIEAKPDLHPLWELRALVHTGRWREAADRGLLDPPPPASLREAMSPGDLHERVNLASWACFGLRDTRSAFARAAKLLAWFDSQDWGRFPTQLLELLARAVTYRTVAARDGGSPARQAEMVPWRRLSHESLTTTSMALEATRHAVLGLREEDWENVVVFSGEALPPSVRLLERLASANLPSELTRQFQALRKALKTMPKKAPSGYILGTLARGFPRAVIVDPISWKGGRLPWPLPCPSPEFRGPVKFALMEAFTTRDELEKVAEVAWELVELRPQDLRPDVFGKAAARPGKAGPAIANLVLYLDRSTVLGHFLRSVQKKQPKAAKLALVTDAFQRWESAFSANTRPSGAR